MKIFFRRIIFFLPLFFLLVFSGISFSQDNAALKTGIYSKLKCCNCGEPFAKCVCPEAKEMKAYIDALVEADVVEEEIFYKFAKRYSLDLILDGRLRARMEGRALSEAGSDSPRLVFSPVSFDFGKVNKKQGKTGNIFKLQNNGKANLIITNIRVSCGCVSVSLKVGKNKTPYFGIAGAPKEWQEKIKPQGLAELEVVLDLKDKSMGKGKQTREVFISSNDPLYPEFKLRVEVEVMD